MAAEAPDPKTFESWEDAFQFAIPAVRRMEQQLRSEISGNRERLRTLVGASYRDLLGTAESIVTMDEEIGHVEGNLGDLGKRCNARLLEKSGSNLTLLERSIKIQNTDRFAFASQLAILQSCPEVITRLLRKGGPVLLAAKVIVLSRLLHKKLSDHQNATSYLDTLRGRLGNLRRKLLSKINQRLGKSQVTKEGLLDAMCAYSLATSSSTADVLRHFHHIRLEAITAEMEGPRRKHNHILEALQCWVTTLHETQTLFPRKLANALAKLKSVSIFNDPTIRSVDEFDFEIHEKWIEDDVKYFTPYIVHDNLQSTATTSQLASWASKAFHSFIQNLHALLESANEPESIANLRKECLGLLISSRSHVVGVSKAEILKRLGGPFLARFLRLIELRCGALLNISSKIAGVLKDWKLATSDIPQSMWKGSVANVNLQAGARVFVEALSDCVYGANEAVRAVVVSYGRWHTSIDELEAIIKQLRNTRWMDDVYDIEDDDDMGDSVQSLLSENDPQAMIAGLNQSLTACFADLEESIGRIVESLGSDGESGSKAAFLLRILREIRLGLPKPCATLDIGRTVLNDLQLGLAKYVEHSPTTGYKPAMTKALTLARVPSRALWDGSPELPILPSSWTMKLLRSRHQAMAAIGSDLWSPPAVQKLKTMLRASLAEELSTLSTASLGANGHDDNGENTPEVDGVAAEDEVTDGDKGEGTDGSTAPSTDSKIQLLFDLSYINGITSKHGDSDADDEFDGHITRVELESKLGGSEIKRVKANAVEYWKRTSLLFALLA
ncbi:hypothetical protein MMC30_007140 [Trapelia coarctata]|nr:hypothetical protein [Trapelia coarctata]